jgi:aspartyl protease family protein
MLKYAVIAVVAALSAVGVAQALGKLDKPETADARAMSAQVSPVMAPAGTAASIAKSADGHYWAQAQVNGSAVRFLVDTGASAVALSPADALRLGFSPDKLVYSYKVTTANGEAHAAKVKLRSVGVAGAVVSDVDALVIDKGLDTSLLGMSYLGRLSRFEATPTSLILRP